MADPRAIIEADVQNAIADTLAMLETSGAADAAAVERVVAATTMGEVEHLRTTLHLEQIPLPSRGRVPPDELWPAIHALEPDLEHERDVYAGRYVDDEILTRIGLTGRVGAITARLRRKFSFPSRLYVFAADFSLEQLEQTERKLQAEHSGLIEQGVPLLAFGIVVLLNRVEIEVERDVDRHAALFRERFGPSVIVVHGEPAYAA